MTSNIAVARAFFEACETGQGWDGCAAYATADAGFSAQSGAIAEITTLADYAEWMKGLLGILPDDCAVEWSQVIFKGLILKGIYGREMFETWYEMSVLVQAGLDIAPVITHRYPYTEFQKGFDAMISGHCGKVVLTWAEG